MAQHSLGASTQPTTSRARRSRRRRLVIAAIGILLGVLAAAAIGFVLWAQPMPLLPEATAALASTEAAAFSQDADGTIVFEPTQGAAQTGLVLYPGGKVPAAAYAPAARAIAEAGFLVAIVDVPFNLAVFDIDAASAVIAAYPEIQRWAVGGHSLGGSMAAQYVAGHPAEIEGLVLWASYSAADIADQQLLVISSYGSLDGAASTITGADSLAKLGGSLSLDEIEGGNHEQMGWYTGQPNDPPATISRRAQQDRIVRATIQLLGDLEGGRAGAPTRSARR